MIQKKDDGRIRGTDLFVQSFPKDSHSLQNIDKIEDTGLRASGEGSTPQKVVVDSPVPFISVREILKLFDEFEKILNDNFVDFEPDSYDKIFTEEDIENAFIQFKKLRDNYIPVPREDDNSTFHINTVESEEKRDFLDKRRPRFRWVK